MAYAILLKPKAKKALARLETETQKRILIALVSLQDDPFQGKFLKGELDGLRSIRVWPYRVMYEIRDRELIVLVIEIKHRKDAYK